MLVAGAADTARVIHRLIVSTSVVCCMLVAASFAMFARDQLAGASKHQQTEIVAGSPATPGPSPIHRARRQPRRFIDGAAADLTSPFRSLIQSDSAWVVEGVPTVLALLVYGVGLGYLARFSRGLK